MLSAMLKLLWDHNMDSMWIKSIFGLNVSLRYNITNFDSFVLGKLNKVHLPACTEWILTINDENLYSLRFRSVGIYSCLKAESSAERNTVLFFEESWKFVAIQNFWRSSLIEIILDKPFLWCLKTKDCNKALIYEGEPEVKEKYINLSFFSNLKAIKKWILKSKATL